MSSILIADDHAVVRAGIRSILSNDMPGLIIAEAANATETLREIGVRAWDLLLLDMHLPDLAGLQLLQSVRAQAPDMRVLIISALPEEQYATEVLRAGAVGFLPKDSLAGDLITAVRRVLSGHQYISSGVAEQMGFDQGKPTLRHEQLSEREQQVFNRLAEGVQITAVATELQLSVKTVSTYRARILEKMGLKTNSDITSYGIRHGLMRESSEASTVMSTGQAGDVRELG